MEDWARLWLQARGAPAPRTRPRSRLVRSRTEETSDLEGALLTLTTRLVTREQIIRPAPRLAGTADLSHLALRSAASHPRACIIAVLHQPQRKSNLRKPRRTAQTQIRYWSAVTLALQLTIACDPFPGTQTACAQMVIGCIPALLSPK